LGGLAFTLLKAGCIQPESAKQVEICLAILPKILSIAAAGENPLAGGRKDVRLFPLTVNLRTVWLIQPEPLDLLSRTPFLCCGCRNVLSGFAGRKIIQVLVRGFLLGNTAG
jgi:hypothetical protein